MTNEFTISKKEPNIKIESGDNILEIIKDKDENIIFKSNKNSLDLAINFYSEELQEWQSYHIFQDFFNRVAGRYYINEANGFYGPKVPSDFVDATGRVITYHSDKTNLGNTLAIKADNRTMVVSLKSSGPVRPARIMVAKKDSGYFGYYQEFNKLYRGLCSIAPEVKEEVSESAKVFSK